MSDNLTYTIVVICLLLSIVLVVWFARGLWDPKLAQFEKDEINYRAVKNGVYTPNEARNELTNFDLDYNAVRFRQEDWWMDHPAPVMFHSDVNEEKSMSNENPNYFGEDEIDKRFNTYVDYKDPEAQPAQIIDDAFKTLATFLDKTLDQGREKSLAFTHLEEASVWAVKAFFESQIIDSVVELGPQDNDYFITKGRHREEYSLVCDVCFQTVRDYVGVSRPTKALVGIDKLSHNIVCAPRHMGM